jgi:hypothetical protein
MVWAISQTQAYQFENLAHKSVAIDFQKNNFAANSFHQLSESFCLLKETKLIIYLNIYSWVANGFGWVWLYLMKNEKEFFVGH